MKIKIIETKNLNTALQTGMAHTPLLESEHTNTLFLNLAGGQQVPPCTMSAAVLYYVVEGEGTLIVEGDQSDLQTGSLALVPAGTTRSISAVVPMRVLAVQIF